MMSHGPVRFRTESVNLLNLLLKYWKILLAIAAAAFLVSAAITLSLTPLYRSAVVLYPTTNVSETRTLFGIQNTSTPLFGDETATEKVLQILKSDDIKNYLVEKYNLLAHYGINERAKYKYTLLDTRMKKYIVSRKTTFNSVEISVLDADPLLAATMANDIARRIDTVFNQIVRDAGRKEWEAIDLTYRDQFEKVRSLEDSLKMIIPKNTGSAIPDNLMAGTRGTSWASASAQFSPQVLRLINMFESENENLSSISSRLTEAKMLAGQNLPYTHVINEGRVAEKKALPKRSRIVIYSVFSSVLCAIFFLALSQMVTRDDR